MATDFLWRVYDHDFRFGSLLAIPGIATPGHPCPSPSHLPVFVPGGNEIKYIARCTNIREYIDSLNSKDSVVLESINNAFYWADQIEKQGADCIIVYPHRFKIIKESWNKTDKRDAANLSLALWMSELQDSRLYRNVLLLYRQVRLLLPRFKMPTVFKPSAEIRELRKYFSHYQMITTQAT